MPLHKGQAVRLNRPYGVLPTGTRLKLLGAKRRIVPVRLTDDRFPKLPSGFQRRFSVPIWFLTERRTNPASLDSTPPLFFPSCSLARLARRANPLPLQDIIGAIKLKMRLAEKQIRRGEGHHARLELKHAEGLWVYALKESEREKHRDLDDVMGQLWRDINKPARGRNPGPLCPANAPCLPRQPNLGEPELGPEGRAAPPSQFAERQIRRIDYKCAGIRTGAGLCSLRSNRVASYKHHFGKGRRPLLLGGGEIRGRVRVETSMWVAGIADAEQMAYPARRHNAAMSPVGYLETIYLVDGTVKTYPPGTLLMTDSQRDCLYIRQVNNLGRN